MVNLWLYLSMAFVAIFGILIAISLVYFNFRYGHRRIIQHCKFFFYEWDLATISENCESWFFFHEFNFSLAFLLKAALNRKKMCYWILWAKCFPWFVTIQRYHKNFHWSTAHPSCNNLMLMVSLNILVELQKIVVDT